MKPLIRILHLEDDPADVELVQAKLEEAGLSIQITRVETRGEFDEALRQDKYDIILADYRLPMYDGMSALHLVQELCPDVPFIFVSGTIGEEEAIEGLTKGAIDYVLKQNLLRLGSAVKRALNEAENRREREQVQRALQESEEFLNNIVENIPNMIFVKDAEKLRFVRFNKAGEQLLGYSQEEMLGKTDYDFFPKEEADFFTAKDREVLSTKKLVDIPEELIKNRDNDERILHTKKIPIMHKTGTPQYLLGISEDITVNKKLEKQLRQAQKMEAVGQLAGGVAHDFNNMLGVIIGHTELAMDRLDPSHELFGDLQEILKAAKYSSDLTRQLLAFARKQTISPRVLDLNETIEGILKILRRLIGEDIDLSWLPGARVWPVKMDPSQIDQILANLCVNARDAIAGVGKVSIETHTITFDEVYCADHPGFIPGEYVLLAVSDNGCGIDKETLDKLFEPFFTTKGMGKGTGLGLSTVYGIVKQNNGFINVYSEPRLGTTFKIYLPRHAAKADQMPKERPSAPAARGHETILLAEDDPALLKLTRTILERLGYQVLAASNPGEAVRVAKEYTGEIHLLITDVVMPEMNGRDLTKNLIALYPGLKHLFMSGYTGSVIAHHGVLDEGENFIQKPFSMQALAAKVREVLDSK
jgi:PAS domain S-box-containing protein